MRYPLAQWRVTQAFGAKDVDYSPFGLAGHHGIDAVAGVGTPVFAAESGVVEKSANGIADKYTGRFAAGETITINGNYETWYMHLNQRLVSAGQRVSEGQHIGYSGNTGYSTGPHLHFGVRPLNPNINNGYRGFIDPNSVINKPAQGGDNMPIPDADNYYWRYGQKLAEQVRGRQLSRAEFSQHLAGKTDLRAVEILSDDPEADRALEAQRLGQLAQRDNWQGQIYGLQAQIAELNKRPTQEQLDALNKQVGDLNTSVQQAHDEAAKTKAELEAAKQNQFTQADRDTQNKILSLVQTIFDYFKGQYKSFKRYIGGGK